MNIHAHQLQLVTPKQLPTTPLAPSLEPTRLRLMAALAIFDLAAIVLIFLAVGAIYLGELSFAGREAMLVAPLFVLFGFQGGLYKSNVLLSHRETALKLLYVTGTTVTFLLIVSFYTKTTASFSRVILTVGCSIAYVVLLGVRASWRAWVRRRIGASLHNTLILQAGGPDVRLENAYYVNTSDHEIAPDASDPANLDRLGRYMENMDRVIVSCAPEERGQWVPLLRAAGVEGEFVSSNLWHLGALELRNEPGFTGIVVSARPLSIGARVIKRAVDLTVSTLALILLAPVMAVVAILIKLEDGGPIFFWQRRMGVGNRFFWISKFRSMRVEAADLDGKNSATRDDGRTTKIGSFIRRTSIDELPQLFNVWLGDMSLVGPRPHALASQAGEKLFWEIDGRYWNRHALKPGVTGLAQVRGFRGATECEQDLADRLQADLEYIANWSLWLDLKIIAKTFGVLLHERAY
jgi:exopolysaccharide biosynthesis polyprenyl glycosylphosphotransferase